MSDELSRLADAHGIARDYHDIWGVRHEVPEATLAALLAAMGVPAANADAAAAAQAEQNAERDTPGMAPIVVLRDGASPWTVRVVLPRAAAHAPLAARLSREDGTGEDSLDVRVLRQHPPWRADAKCVQVDVALSAELAPGYHRLEIFAGGDVVARSCCAVAPPTCYLPPSPPPRHRTFGAAAQLYGLRSERNWGIGDFTDLSTLIEQWGDRGAGIVGVNPLHALFPHDPSRASPYSPSSRLFRNPLYLDVEAIAEFRECADARLRVASPAFQSTLAALRDAPLVDYAGVAAAKHAVLELLFRHFCERHLAAGDERARAFHAYAAAGGDRLHCHALYEALQEHLHRVDAAAWGWPAWPAAFRDPASPDVARFATDRAARIDYFIWLQWQAELQVEAAAARARATGMAIGLYTDLAVSIDRGGAEAWANQDIYALGASVGAPPDAFNPNGQDWGLPPLVPARLRNAAYAPFLATLRANMRHAGALRIDHVMGLARLFWVPAGRRPADGGYVHYPFDDLLGLLALESHRHRCVVIGEDLGTVPDYIREALARNAVLSYRVLLFERDGAGAFKPPAAYPVEAVVTASTHDLPTLAGWWTGADIELRAKHGLIANDADREAQLHERLQARRCLLVALEQCGLLPAGITTDPIAVPQMTPALACAAQAYLAATPSRLAIVQLEDLAGVTEQANLPGTTTTHPNWRRKLPSTLDTLRADARFDALTATLARERPPAAPAFAPRAAPHVPLATYRLQLNRSFTFADAAALVPYLAALGVSHAYCSPYLRARPGSLHGYDIVDHSMVNPEIGSRADFDRFVAALDAHGMGHICDVVPNHVGVMGSDNRWWMDVLENGPASASADHFDIDWTPLDPDLAGRILVPVLGDVYGTVLERGELELMFEAVAGTIAVHYHEHRFPLDPRTFAALLATALDRCRGALPADAAAAIARLVDSLRALPSREARDANTRARRRRDSEACKADLARLSDEHPEFAAAVAAVVDETNGTPGAPDSYDALHALLEAQAFRLVHWRVASDEINYRRFFDVNDLAALRMENETVFEATHGFVLRLAAAGVIHGLRIDHPDGLHDPAAYLLRVQARYRELAAAAHGVPAEAVPPLYVVLEKIIASHERLSEEWPVCGTTGYRFANVVNGLFVASAAKARLDRTWRAFVGAEADDADGTVVQSKLAIMHGPLAAELTLVANLALRIARGDRRTRDFTFNALRGAIEEIVARFPVYRTYVSARGASAQDRRYIEWALARARRESRTADPSVFDFMRTLMLGSAGANATAERTAAYRAFAMRFQQFTAPVTAKGVEDTAYYRFNRLVSLNDVGGDPEQFGITVRAFHGASLDRAAVWPATMLATSTHDNKRSGDVRARINVISEQAAEWRLAVRRWNRMNRGRKREVDGREAPSRNDEYLLYQTLIGTLPAGDMNVAMLARYCARIEAYAVKAAREAKVHTSWLSVDSDYEEALVAFVRALLAPGERNMFLQDLRRQIVPYAWFGRLNSVSMALLKFASPGVPDLYQGTELLELRLVDPDNRGAVDYGERRARLAELEALSHAAPDVRASAFAEWFANLDDGRAKLWVTYRLLQFRALHREMLAGRDYLPVTVTGAHADHVVAFARRGARQGAIAVAGRLFASLGALPGTLPLGEDVWGDTALDLQFVPAGAALTNVLTGEMLEPRDGHLPLARAFRVFPGAVFHYQRED